MYIVRQLLGLFFTLLEFTVIGECIGSWIPVFRDSRLYYFILKVNSPFLTPIRRILDKSSGPGMMVDISPFVLFLLISFIRKAFMI